MSAGPVREAIKRGLVILAPFDGENVKTPDDLLARVEVDEDEWGAIVITVSDNQIRIHSSAQVRRVADVALLLGAALQQIQAGDYGFYPTDHEEEEA